MLKRLLCIALLASGAMPLHASGQAAASGAAIYHALEPAFVVNLQEGRRLRFMQVKVQVMTRDKKVVDALLEHGPAVRDAMIMLLAHQSAEAMRSTSGREALRGEALSALQEVLARQAHREGGIEAVYFTDYVIQ